MLRTKRKFKFIFFSYTLKLYNERLLAFVWIIIFYMAFSDHSKVLNQLDLIYLGFIIDKLNEKTGVLWHF